MPLTREQALELCCVIEDRRASLLDELRKDMDQTRADSLEEITKAVPDTGDESVARMIADLDQAEVTRELDELRRLEEARQRFDKGSYGSCTDCGSEIDYRRLRVNPAAIRCIRCQTHFEKTFASTARTSL
jgi:RNA polymerase-binding transcription factor DksA